MIPICGKKKKGEMKMKSHGWTYSKKDDYYIDGDPKTNPYNGVGNFGLSIAMMPNERTKGIHNCQFIHNYLVVALPIKKGDELTVYYGKQYEAVRIKKGYSLKENSDLQHEYTLEKLGEKDYPKNRKEIYESLNETIARCES